MRMMESVPADSTATPGNTPSAGAPTSHRVVSIDALRGFDMFWIVGGKELLFALLTIVLNPLPAWLEGQFQHAEWIGFTAWDLIMPLFLFVVGTAMPFSFSRRLEGGHSKAQLYIKILRRTAILFVLGMAVQGHLLDFKLSTLHVFANTLQAIAVGYLIAGVVILNVGVRGQIAFATLMLIGYWLLLTYIPLKEHGAGALEPRANVALAVDQYVLGRFVDGTTYTWVLSGMTFSATVLLGVFSGHILRSGKSASQKVSSLVLLGIACLGAGWAWAEGLGFPIIKHIWTSSMVLWAGGWSYLLLALFYLLIDVWGFRRWAFPFVVVGMNAITIYVAWRFIPFKTIAQNLVGVADTARRPGIGLAGHVDSAGPLLIALTTVAIWWLILFYMYRQKIFLRL